MAMTSLRADWSRWEVGGVTPAGNTCGSCRLLTAALSPFHKLPENTWRRRPAGGERLPWQQQVLPPSLPPSLSVCLDTLVIVRVRAVHMQAGWTWKLCFDECTDFLI